MGLLSDQSLLAKTWYFFYFGSIVCVWPYLNLLYRANGLDDAQIGVLAAIKPWVSAPSSFLWSGLADRYSLHKAVLLGTFVVSTLTRSSTVAAHSFGAFMLLAAAGEFVAAPVGVMADAAVVAACKRDTDYGKSRLWGAVAWGGLSTFSGWLVSSYGMPSGFAAYLLLSIPCVFCAWHMDVNLGSKKQQSQQHQHSKAAKQGAEEAGSGELNSVGSQSKQKQQQVQVDGMQCDSVELGDQDLEQQPLVQQRDLNSNSSSNNLQLLLGDSSSSSGGSGVDVLVLPHCSTGLDPTAVNLPQQQQQQQQHVVLPMNAQATSSSSSSSSPVSRAAAAAVKSAAEARPAAAPHPQQQQQQQQPEDFWVSLQLLLRRPEVLIFMGQATAMGFGIGVIGEFLFLFLQELGGSETLMGLTLTFTCLAEVPVFHYQGTVLRYISVHTMLHIVMWTYAIRLGLYALLPYAHSPWAVLPVELLHGITFACGWGAGTINSKRVAPPELAATMQGIFQGLYFGVGQGLGALIGGVLKERFGGQAMFAMCAALILAAWLLVLAAELLTGTSSRTACQEAACADACSGGSLAGPETPADTSCGHQRHQYEQQPVGAEVAGGARQQQQSWWGVLKQALLNRQAAVQAAAAARRRRQAYLELGSKDSGPDLGVLRQ